MPNNQPRLGLLGIHVLHNFSHHIYAGPGIYSAVQGKYNGLFILGFNAGIDYPIISNLSLDAGFFAGSGGGSGLSNRIIGNGSTIIAHAGMKFSLPAFTVGVNDSYTVIGGNKVKENQLLTSLEIPFSLYGVSEVTDKTPAYTLNASPVPFYIAFNTIIGYPTHAYLDDEKKITNLNTMIGIEFGQYLFQNLFYYFNAAASMRGGFSGFMELQGGAGVSLPIVPNRLLAILRASVGSGGGGAVKMGSGLFTNPEAGLELFLTRHISLRTLAGYFYSFNNKYSLTTLSLGLAYHFTLLSSEGQQKVLTSSKNIYNLRLRIANQTYLNPNNRETDSHPIQLLAIKFDHLLNQHWFITGQTAFAYTGKIPGYATGTLGLGYQLHLNKAWLIFASLPIGAAGGAHIHVGGGLMTRPTIGAMYKINPTVGLYSSIAKLLPLKGSFSPLTAELGISYNFNFLG